MAYSDGTVSVCLDGTAVGVLKRSSSRHARMDSRRLGWHGGGSTQMVRRTPFPHTVACDVASLALTRLPLHTCDRDEHTFLAKCDLNSKNLQCQDDDNSMSSCEECTKVTGEQCQKNKHAINHWVHDGFIDILNPDVDRVASLQNSTAIHVCVADAMAMLTLAEEKPGGGQEMP